MENVDRRLFTSSDGHTYLFSRKNYENGNSHATLCRLDGTSEISEPLITKDVKGKEFCRYIAREAADGSSSILPKHRMPFDKGYFEVKGTNLKIAGDMYASQKIDSLKELDFLRATNLSPAAKRILRKVGEFLSKIK